MTFPRVIDERRTEGASGNGAARVETWPRAWYAQKVNSSETQM